MKKLIYIIIIVLISSFLACEDVALGPRKPDGSWNAGPITDFTIMPINGGAEITYTISSDPDVMYVMAEYERNGKTFTEKSSIHKNKITIEGFHRVNKVKANLYKVNKYEQRSEPLEIEFEPLESLIDIAFNSLEFITAFGGIIASWDNPETTELGVRVMTYDDSLYHDMVTREMYYSMMEKERHAFRGYDPVETIFAVLLEDKWGNVSDTIKFTTTPFFETTVQKPYADYREIIPYDNTTELNSNYPFIAIWDNIVNTSRNGWLSQSGSSGLSFTIDMQQMVKLSRILHHAYHINAAYYQVNITEMEIWGAGKIDYTKLSDRDYWLDSLSVRQGRYKGVDPTMELPERTFKDDWQYLGYHAVPFYTAIPDIQALSQNGAEYEMSIEAAPVRYIRIFVRAVTLINPPPINNYFSLGEITFYGDNTVPQE